jgi:ketosteroid isomerase-like protein
MEVCMTARLSKLLLAALFLTACADGAREESAETAAASEVSPDEAAIDQIRTDYIAHYNQAHPQIVAAFFTDSAFGLWADGAIRMGKPAIEAGLQEDLGTPPTPTLDLQNGELTLFGDRAVGRGTYAVNVTPPQGAPATINGSYLTYFVKANGEWKIHGVLTNFHAPPPEGTPLKEPEGEPPPDEGTMKEFVASYMQAYNAGDWAAVANFYAEDAQVAFANIAPLSGKAAVQARFVERFGTNKPTLEVHDVGTVDLDATHKLDGGWYTLNALSPEGARMTQSGTFLNLLEQQADGSWKIKWAVTNGNPRPAA